MRGAKRRFGWGMAMLLSLPALAGCAGHHVYKLYPGPEQPESGLATIRFGLFGASDLRIDGMTVDGLDYTTVQLLPGPHRLEFVADWAGTPAVYPAMRGAPAGTPVLDLAAGREYIVGSSLGGDCQAYLCTCERGAACAVAEWVAP